MISCNLREGIMWLPDTNFRSTMPRHMIIILKTLYVPHVKTMVLAVLYTAHHPAACLSTFYYVFGHTISIQVTLQNSSHGCLYLKFRITWQQQIGHRFMSYKCTHFQHLHDHPYTPALPVSFILYLEFANICC